MKKGWAMTALFFASHAERRSAIGRFLKKKLLQRLWKYGIMALTINLSRTMLHIKKIIKKPSDGVNASINLAQQPISLRLTKYSYFALVSL